MVVELGERVVLDMGPAILHLHAGSRTEDMVPTYPVLLSGYLGRSEQSRKRAWGRLIPLNTGIAEEDEVPRADMLIDPARVVVHQLPGRIDDLEIGVSRRDSGNDRRRRRPKYSVDEGERVGVKLGDWNLVAEIARTSWGCGVIGDGRVIQLARVCFNFGVASDACPALRHACLCAAEVSVELRRCGDKDIRRARLGVM